MIVWSGRRDWSTDQNQMRFGYQPAVDADASVWAKCLIPDDVFKKVSGLTKITGSALN